MVNWQNRALFTRQRKFRLPLELSLLLGSRPKSAMANPQQCTQSASYFITNRFTFGGVIAERVNAA